MRERMVSVGMRREPWTWISPTTCCCAAPAAETRDKSRKNASQAAAEDFNLRINATNEGTRCPERFMAQQKNAATPESCKCGLGRKTLIIREVEGISLVRRRQ